jgi:hypothetical protein
LARSLAAAAYGSVVSAIGFLGCRRPEIDVLPFIAKALRVQGNDRLCADGAAALAPSGTGIGLSKRRLSAPYRDGVAAPGGRGLAVEDGIGGGGAPPVAAAPAPSLWAPLIAAPEPRLPSGLWRAGVSVAPGGRGLCVCGMGCAAVPAFGIPDDRS